MNAKRSVLFLLLLLSAFPVLARGKKGSSPTSPGVYKSWGDDIDELEIVQSFKLSDYNRIVVTPFDTDKTALPETSDNTYKPVAKVLAGSTELFVKGLSEELDGTLKVEEASRSNDAKTLVVRASVLEMDPGSKAARYWAGFGAGAARAKVRTEVVDAKSGKVLFRFTQERRSGVGVAGGDYVNLMSKNVRSIGKDLAAILKKF